ncbi:MAG: hypothetical protein HOQ05_11725 [Corynebacteriales bacterium]|nr:hypothetical protein [Mycobacteriales bacterium]
MEPPPGLSRRFLSALAVTFLAIAGLSAMATSPALAEPEPTLAEAERQVSTLAEQMTVTNEEYQEASVKLEDSRGRQGEVERELSEAQGNFEQEQTKVGLMGATAYETGPFGAMNVLVGATSTQELLDQLSYLDIISGEQNQALNDLVTTRDQVREKKRQIDEEVTTQTEQERILREKKEQLDGELKEWQDKRSKLQPKGRSHTRYTYDGTASGLAEAAVQYAYNQIGKPYELNADGPSTFDCSGLTMMAWKQSGISLPHSSRQQYNSVGTKVDRSALAPGDLIIFYSDMHHVGIYIGSGNVIHAPQPGEYVKVSPVTAMPYAGAVRPG